MLRCDEKGQSDGSINTSGHITDIMMPRAKAESPSWRDAVLSYCGQPLAARRWSASTRQGDIVTAVAAPAHIMDGWRLRHGHDLREAVIARIREMELGRGRRSPTGRNIHARLQQLRQPSPFYRCPPSSAQGRRRGISRMTPPLSRPSIFRMTA